ncbi:uncharacterized protein LOC113312134 [Papaver somniferum]|uniref:uncharacterized protein LOC113312134 n=1 Tax=Papaver somniferum TaxID=3469 RepID=UPI000E7043FD|nr:uncharacterized protein LOC113312134 [Papaver somniferum]
MDECEKDFNEIKQYLSTPPPPPVLVNPKTGQPIEVYLAAIENVVSAVLFVTDPHKKPVYFVSKSLTGAEAQYKKIDKISLALLHASRRLKPYFQVTQIVVYPEYPLKRILERADDSNRLAIWSNFLGAYEIKYETKTAEKGHPLATLLVDFPVDHIETVATEDEELFKHIESATDQTGGGSTMDVDTPEPLWTIFTDESLNVGGAGVGCVILTPEGSRIEKATRLGFQASNNDVEYEALIIGLKAFKQLDAKNVKLVTDFMLVVNQFLGTYRAKEERMTLYMDRMREMANEFEQFSIGQRPRMENRHADALAYLSSAVETDTIVWGERGSTSTQGDTENIDNNMDVDSPVIDDSGNHAENVADWRQPYIQYLTTGELPKDEHLASKVKKNAWRYSTIEGQLYRKPVAFEPFLRCISAEEGQQILAEAHESLAILYVGTRIVEPLPKAPGGVRFVLAATDYFTKWVEAVELVHVTRHDVERFIWENIICRFGIPDAIVSDNGKQFDYGVIKDFCKVLNICHNFSSPYYAQSNGKAEATNRVIMDNLKKRLEKVNGKWTEEFPGVLWSYRTTQKRSTGFFPFTLAYETEEVTPTEVHLKTTKTRAVKSGKNDSILALDKELLEEQRETALQQLVRYQQEIKMSYDRKVRERSFKPGEYVLKKTRAATMEPNFRNLGANWEGPYIVDRPASRGSYYLRNLDGTKDSKPWNPWNSFHFKKFYH